MRHFTFTSPAVLAGLAAAVTGLASAPARAQSSVSIYGLIDASVERVRVSDTGTVNRVASGSGASSRWGLRGQEDLGGGLKASFALESGFAVDTGTASRLFSRQAWVGLGSAMLGEVRLGRQNTPMLDAMVPTDADFASNFSPITPFLLSNLDQVRLDNMVSYTTPRLAGFDAMVAVAPGERLATAGGGTRRSDTEALLRYQSGPVLATLAYHQGGQNAAASAQQRGLYGALRYDLGVAALSAAYYEHRNELSTGPQARMQGIVAGVVVPVGAWSFTAQCGYGQDDGNAYATGAPKPEGRGTVRLYNVGAIYNVSRRTLLYARYAHAADSNASFNGRPNVAAFGITNDPTNRLAAAGSASNAAVGLLHRF